LWLLSFDFFKVKGSFDFFKVKGSFDVFKVTGSFDLFKVKGSFEVFKVTGSFDFFKVEGVLAFGDTRVFDTILGLEENLGILGTVKISSSSLPSILGRITSDGDLLVGEGKG